MSESINRSFGLDFARALAISIVLISHFGHKSLGSLGFWGVELFFALSGFLIGQILWRNFSSISDWNFSRIFNFWSRRWWRTLPNYYLFFLVSLLFYHYNGDGLPLISRLVQFLWFGQNLFSFYWGFYSVSWSLCIEEWFYLLFPIVLFVFSLFKISKKNIFICALIFFFVVSMIIRLLLIHTNAGDHLATTTFARLDSICCGVLVSFISAVVKPGVKLKNYAFFIGLILIVSPVCLAKYLKIDFDTVIQNPVLLVIVPMGFAIMLPVIGSITSFGFGKSLINVVVEKLSLWSYSIYLSHLYIMWLVYFIMDKYRGNGFVNLLSKIIGVIITIFISAILFEFFEKPLTRKRPRELENDTVNW